MSNLSTASYKVNSSKTHASDAVLSLKKSHDIRIVVLSCSLQDTSALVLALYILLFAITSDQLLVEAGQRLLRLAGCRVIAGYNEQHSRRRLRVGSLDHEENYW